MNKAKLAFKVAVAAYKTKKAIGSATDAVKKGGQGVTQKLRLKK